MGGAARNRAFWRLGAGFSSYVGLRRTEVHYVEVLMGHCRGAPTKVQMKGLKPLQRPSRNLAMYRDTKPAPSTLPVAATTSLG